MDAERLVIPASTLPSADSFVLEAEVELCPETNLSMAGPEGWSAGGAEGSESARRESDERETRDERATRDESNRERELGRWAGGVKG